MSDVRPIHLPGAAVTEQLRRRAQGAVDAWARDWIGGPAERSSGSEPVRLSPLARTHDARSYEHELMLAEQGSIWFRTDEDHLARFARAVVGAELMAGTECIDAWTTAVVERARQARDYALCAALLGAPQPRAGGATTRSLPASLFAFGSGAIELVCEPLGLHAIADAGVWNSVPPSARAHPSTRLALVPLDSAARRAQVHVELRLGEVELELPMVLDLRRGDVLRLPQRLSDPLTVLCEGEPLAVASIAALEGRKCAQVRPI
jgi:hypothetical protein